MRKVILGLAVSLDSLIEGPNGEYDWCFTDQDYGMGEFLSDVDTILIGRKSWDLLVRISEGTGRVNPYPGKTMYVFSNTMKHVDEPGVKIISGDMLAETRRIIQQPGKNIWLYGGAALVTLLMNEHLVDELWLSVHPVVLGSGKPLFHELRHRTNFRLVSHKIYDTGLVSLLYRKQ